MFSKLINFRCPENNLFSQPRKSSTKCGSTTFVYYFKNRPRISAYHSSQIPHRIFRIVQIIYFQSTIAAIHKIHRLFDNSQWNVHPDLLKSRKIIANSIWDIKTLTATCYHGEVLLPTCVLISRRRASHFRGEAFQVFWLHATGRRGLQDGGGGGSSLKESGQSEGEGQGERQLQRWAPARGLWRIMRGGGAGVEYREGGGGGGGRGQPRAGGGGRLWGAAVTLLARRQMREGASQAADVHCGVVRRAECERATEHRQS